MTTTPSSKEVVEVALFLFCNPSSGGNAAKQVIDIVGKRMEFAVDDGMGSIATVLCYNMKSNEERAEGFEALRVCASSQPGDKARSVKVIVCGGDGTVKWVISELVRVDVLHVPIGIIPFGTGNDLSRVSGWGAASPDLSEGRAAMEMVLSTLVLEGETTEFDTWKVDIEVSFLFCFPALVVAVVVVVWF